MMLASVGYGRHRPYRSLVGQLLAGDAEAGEQEHAL